VETEEATEAADVTLRSLATDLLMASVTEAEEARLNR